MASEFTITALYKFFHVNDPPTLKANIESLCENFDVKGMLIVAPEGINGTICATPENMQKFIERLYTIDERLKDMEIKFSSITADDLRSVTPAMKPFYRMRVALKKEIVTLGLSEDKIDSVNERKDNSIIDLSPDEWNEVICRKEVKLVDTRNDYEVRLGTFTGAVNPSTKSFKEFPSFLNNQLEDLRSSKETKQQDFAIFCTGGIRCDKVSSYMSTLDGVGKIYRLKGGILKYLETVPSDQSLWEGECFVFDQRVSVVSGLQRGQAILCRGCRQPLTQEEADGHAHYKAGIHCLYCIEKLTDAQKQAAAERDKQMTLSVERKEQHLGQKHSVRKRARKVASSESLSFSGEKVDNEST